MPDIHSSKAIVIGGTHGIGLATAQLLISKRATVIVTGRNPANLESAKQTLGDGAIVHKCDVTSFESMSNIATRVSQIFGADPQLP